MDKANSFRDRISGYQLERKVFTQEELKNISRNFIQQNSPYLDMDKEINLEQILFRCKGTIQNGEKYILTPRDEGGSNLAEITPLEELALMELFKAGDSYNNEVIVLLNNARVKLEWNNRNSMNKIETIEISFENMQGKDDIQNEFEN